MHEPNLVKLQGEIEKSIVTVGDQNITFSAKLIEL